jgi:AhpC/TSA family/Disulphide bond corrector protein DsbC
MFEANGFRIAAISYDSQDSLAAFARRYQMGFPLLSDRGSTTIREFGIFNFNMAPDLRAYGVPHPVEYLLTPEGIVIRKYFVPNYQHRVTGSAVALREFGAMADDAAKVVLQSGALTAFIGFPIDRAFAGQQVSFRATFALEPGWHVYGAPLPDGYTSTSIIFDDPRISRQSFTLPEPEIMEIPALGETFPVYSGSFQGIGALLLKFPIPDGRLVLRGRLGVQQCSETVCEPPLVIPFELPLTLEPFMVAERK